MGFLSSIFGGGDAPQINVELPEYQHDEYYGKTQPLLFDLGSNILSGNIPDYYKPIGEFGGQSFQDMIGEVVKNVTGATNTNLISRNLGRGGIGASAIARNLTSGISNLAWSDFMRAMQGRSSLLTTGINTVSGVRGAGLEKEGMLNKFELAKKDLELNIAKTNAALEQEAEEQGNAMFSDILSGVGTIAGYMLAGPPGAVAGSAAGSMAASGGGYQGSGQGHWSSGLTLGGVS